MSTPWTMTRMRRWCMRDWALSLLACGFILDVEPHALCSSSDQSSISTRVSRTKGSCRCYDCETVKRASRGGNESNREKKLVHGSTRNTRTPRRRKITDISCWPPFAEEDYIVFCFREDGAFDVLKSRPSSHNEGSETGSSRVSVHHKQYICREEAEEAQCSSNVGEKGSVTNENEEYLTLLLDENPLLSDNEVEEELEEVEEERTIYIDSEGSLSSKWGDGIEIEDKRLSLESKSSNQSDGSAGSFAFPVLKSGWLGSPIQMPKADSSFRLRKQRTRCVGFHCCKF